MKDPHVPNHVQSVNSRLNISEFLLSHTPKLYLAVAGGSTTVQPEESLTKAYESYCDEYGEPIDFNDVTFYEVNWVNVELKKEVVTVNKVVTTK